MATNNEYIISNSSNDVSGASNSENQISGASNGENQFIDNVDSNYRLDSILCTSNELGSSLNHINTSMEDDVKPGMESDDEVEVEELIENDPLYNYVISEYGLFEGIKMAEDTDRWGLRDVLFEMRDIMQQIADEHPLSDLEDLVCEVGLERLLDLARDNPFMREQFLLLRQMEDAWNVTSGDLLNQHGLFEAIDIARNNRYMCGHYDDLMEIMDHMQQVANEHPPEVEDMSHLIDIHGFERAVKFAFKNPFMEDQLDLLSLIFSWSVTPESMIEKYGLFGALLTTYTVKYMDTHRDDIMSEVNRSNDGLSQPEKENVSDSTNGLNREDNRPNDGLSQPEKENVSDCTNGLNREDNRIVDNSNIFDQIVDNSKIMRSRDELRALKNPMSKKIRKENKKSADNGMKKKRELKSKLR